MVKRYRFVAQTQTDGKVDCVFDSAECVSAFDYDALEAENARLEAALRLIADAKDVRGCDEIARQALQSETTPNSARRQKCNCNASKGSLHAPWCASEIGLAPETNSKQPDEYAAHSHECYLRKYREGFCDCELSKETDVKHE